MTLGYAAVALVALEVAIVNGIDWLWRSATRDGVIPSTDLRLVATTGPAGTIP